MTKYKVSELKDERLDYWVAKAGEVWKEANKMYPTWTLDSTFKGVEIIDNKCVLIPNNPMRQDLKIYSPSTDWSQGGPILANLYEQGLQILKISFGVGYIATLDGYKTIQMGPGLLVTVMRCFVASKFGEEVEE